MEATRRRVLFIGASYLGAAVLGASTFAGSATAAAPLRRWRGHALGAHATIALHGAPEEAATAAFAAVEQEIARLEAVFSLYDSGSALSRLNRAGHLDAPPPELVEVLALARSVHRLTGGLFDPTVQPVFAALAEHYAQPDVEGPPDPEAIAAALGGVGLARVDAAPDRIAFGRSAMALTLNGIAQGYVNDRIAALLRARGFADMLLDIGEISALGRGPSGHGWRVGVPSGGDIRRLTVSERAVATSAMRGTTLDAAGRVGHIVHPRLGVVAGRSGSVTVVDPSAARADALSTAAALMYDAEIAELRRAGVEIYV